MMRVIAVVGLVILGLVGPARAIENIATSSYNEAVPTSAQIPNWTTGWTQPTVQPQGYTSTTGWNYVGSVGGNSAVYLGNGWVITAAHVGAGALSLDNVSYPEVAGTAQNIEGADLVVFKVSPSPALPPLTIRSTDPVAGSSPIAMLGWGHANGDRVPTWGYNTVTTINQALPLTENGVTYNSNDLLTLTQNGTGNNYEVVVGDSGGADFIYNTTTKAWELAGINEATVTDNLSRNYSAMVQLDTYLPQINTLIASVDTPTLSPLQTALLAGLLLAAALQRKPRAYLPRKASSNG